MLRASPIMCGPSRIRQSRSPISRALRVLGQFYPKRASMPIARLDPHAPAHALHAAADDGQADARAGELFKAVQALEDVEDALVVLGSDADAVVLDREAGEAVATVL